MPVSVADPSRPVVACTVVAMIIVASVGCGRSTVQSQDSSGPAPTELSSQAAAPGARDDYMPSITVDGMSVSFPIGTQTVWAAGARPSMSCDRQADGLVVFRWAGKVPGSDAFSTSSVRVKMFPDATHQLALADVSIVIDASKSPAPTVDPLRGGFWANAGGDIRNGRVTTTASGFAVRADVRWQDASPTKSAAWHALSMNLVCHA